MAFELQNIVPWGRNLTEYKLFFNLSEKDLKRNILSVADGPASFNAEMHELGHYCTSFDPIYNFSAQQITDRIQETKEEIRIQLYDNKDNFVWKHVSKPEELIKIRLLAMIKFLDHFDRPPSKGRYIPGELPKLPFPDNNFDLVLCSHFLFLYSDHLDLDFHLTSIREMYRVGKEIRIFPLVDIDAKPSPYVEKCIEIFKNENIDIKIQKVNYEFQKGGNKMLVIKR